MPGSGVEELRRMRIDITPRCFWSAMTFPWLPLWRTVFMVLRKGRWWNGSRQQVLFFRRRRHIRNRCWRRGAAGVGNARPEKRIQAETEENHGGGAGFLLSVEILGLMGPSGSKRARWQSCSRGWRRLTRKYFSTEKDCLPETGAAERIYREDADGVSVPCRILRSLGPSGTVSGEPAQCRDFRENAG